MARLPARIFSAQSHERLSALEEWYAAAQSFPGDLLGYPVSG
jgi:hypothetical protein